MKETVGFMGLGIMGVPMATRILQAGYPLVVYNRTPEKAKPLSDLGAAVALSPKDLAARCDVVILMVTGPEAIDALLWGEDGASQAMDGQKVLVNMSSVSPQYTLQFHEKLSASGIPLVDAPVSGSKKPAEDGTLIVLAGGEREHVDRLTPLLETMGKKVVYCGGAGQGSMMKMMINLLLGLMMEGFAEVLHFGRQGGLSMEAMLDVILSGPLSCGLYQIKAGSIQSGDYPVSFPLKHITKDLKFVVDTAYETGASAPAAHTLLHLYRTGVGQGWGDLDFAAIAKVLEHMSAKEKSG